MTTPAADCGVTAGCGACPLGRAGVCGDPGTDAPTVTINDRGYLRREAVGRGDNGHGAPLINDTLTEHLSEAVHDAWMDSKRAQGVTSRFSETGEELMVPYWRLSEPAKNLDRGTVRGVLAAVASLGGRVVLPDDTPDRDPAEPRPADAGCCGGGCGG